MDLRRFGVELRAEMTGTGKVRGHAAVFDQIADVGRAGYERIEQRAFDRVLANPDTDVRALINHNPSHLLGRQSAGTLRLDTDDRGLVFEVDLPDTSYARDLEVLIERGDLNGASFGFIPGKDRIERARDGRQVRSHTDVDQLVDVSVVTWPAYSDTDAVLRSVTLDVAPSGAFNRSRLVRARAAVTLNSKETRR